MTQLFLPSQEIKKHNELIRGIIKNVNLDGSRILASLIVQIYPNDEDFKNKYVVGAKDILGKDVGGKAYAELKATVEQLASATVTIERFDAKGDPIFVVIPFFQMVRYEGGDITATFNSQVKPLLLQLKQNFTKYNILEYLTLPSVYSQRIFELLMSWRNLPEFTMDVEKLHRMLNTPPSIVKDFRNFRVRILEKAHKDITKHTHLKYEWEPIRAGKRRVSTVRFVFAQNRAIPIKTTREDDESEKIIRTQSRALKTAIQCLREHGDGVCQGGRQATEVCDICRRLVQDVE